MRCPKCQSVENRVIDSRLRKSGTTIRRRRKCLACGKKFTTVEEVVDFKPMVIKKDGRREKWIRDKILGGILRACEKRPIPTEEIENVVDVIESHFSSQGDREVQSKDIGEMIMAKLHDLDDVAYVRFASVYREFQDVNQFMAQLKKLIKENEKETAS